MINTIKRIVFPGFLVRLMHDNVCCSWNVEVRYLETNGVLFVRDYKTKASALRSYNHWVSKLSSIYEIR